ncbi:MAG: GDP-mannose 4,6-dehydratase [Agathobacter sp.]
MKKYFVTGCAGFIGSNFIYYMLNKYEDILLVNLDKLTYAGNLENLKELEEDSRHIFVRGDICDKVLVAELFDKYDFDYVINFEFSSRGKIKAVDGNQRAVYTIDKLNLDTGALNAAREAAMWESGAMQDITEERCLFLLDKYERADKDGKYAGYSDAIIYHLKKRLKRLRQEK